MLFQLESVTKTYGAVTALEQPFRFRAQRRGRPARPQRLGQDDDDPHPAGPDSGRSGLGRDPRTWISARGSSIFAGRSASRPEDECLFPRVVGVEFVAYAGELVGMRTKDAMQRAHEVLDYVGLGEARYRRSSRTPPA